MNQRTGIKIILKELNMVKNSRDNKIKQAIKSLEKLIDNMDKCVQNVEELALDKKEITKEEELIQSFPGFGSRLAAIVSTETGGFSRFPTST